MSDAERIADACSNAGLSIIEVRGNEDGETEAVLGRFRAGEDGEMWSEEDEGDLVATMVGAAEHGNRRVCFLFTPEGSDSPSEVTDPLSMDPI